MDWCVTKKTEIAERLLNGLVEGVKKRFKELPLNDKELDKMYSMIMDYIGDHIDDSNVFPKLVDLVSHHMINHTRQLSQK